MKRPFTTAQLDAKMKANWPNIGSALREDLVKRLMKNLPKDFTFKAMSFVDTGYDATHRLAVLLRYLDVPQYTKPELPGIVFVKDGSNSEGYA
jgi:hypothetical protein